MRYRLLTGTAILAILVLALVSAEQQTTQGYIDEANGLLLRGKYRDAIRSYDTAIEKDPQNYLTYFKRATTLLSINRHLSAIRDFSRVIELKPDFDQAYYQRARAYAKEGSYSDSEADLAKVSDRSNASLVEKTEKLKEAVALARKMVGQLTSALRDKKYSECIKAASAAIQISPLDTSTIKTRASCRIAEGDLEGASADLGRLVRIHPGDLETQNLLADMHFLALNEPERGLEHVRACLRSDPDNKKCKATYTRLRTLDRKLSKLNGDRAKSKWNTCNRAVAPLSSKGGLLEEVDEMYASFVLAADIPANLPSKLATHLAGIACEGYSHTKKWEQVLRYCKRVLDAEPEDVDALGYQFDAQLESEQLDRALGTLDKLEQVAAATEGGSIRQRMQERRIKLERMKRAASRKDYYKILGISRDATQAEVKKAFRKLAQQWHPDRYRGDLPKDQVESKMADINLAYEVLMDEEARARYDQGHDPNDPSGGADGGPGGFGGSPFVFQQGDGRQFFFQQGGSAGSGKQFSFQFGGPGGFPF
ncbi:TPR-like protein [Coemansia reversa NRRL 1564]|uniref:TPR-like protein n=1 Tax=Coemansia reversa (strain ATCC 12441 / NRRL 1564) TaxID=763665 RepID=A0A2G5BKA5_COERN|nr:TPR-like protein [Coemansia reversa NRRL 1564]|eukprot:PIA19412.1 TPR-like protein [Coemansia reversa NRRL 1564]